MFNSMFNDDPFFSDPFSELRRVSMPGALMINQSPQQRSHAALAAHHSRRSHHHHPAHNMLAPMSPFGMLGGGMGSMFSNMENMMRNMQSNMAQMHAMGPNMSSVMQSSTQMPGSSFQSSFTSISYGNGSGQPQVYQSSSSTTIGPGGVKETKKTEKDSRTGVQKIAIGHHIGDRAHIIEKTKNSRSGDNEESQEYINLEEEEAEEFNNEFKQRIHSSHHSRSGHHGGHLTYHRGRHQPYARHSPQAIEYNPSSSSTAAPAADRRPHTAHHPRQRNHYV